MTTGAQTAATAIETDFVMEWFRPAVDGEATTWRGLIDDMRAEGTLHAEAGRLTRHQTGQVELVVIDMRGYVVAGSDMVIAAYVKGLRKIRCAFLYADA